ncbi:MAG: hypothetical protein JNL01_09170 [Bdellovibrionales bacterium]|nr:hypothetical protein [Bdellovibrionales bacterium]
MKRILVVLAALVLTGCGKIQLDDQDEVVKQVADTMASVDDAGGDSSGTLAFIPMDAGKSFRDWNRSFLDQFSPISSASAAACSSTYSFSCTSESLVRTLSCEVLGILPVNGTVTLTMYDGSSASVGCSGAAFSSAFNAGYSIVRQPNFTITGARGSIQVSSSAGGQKLTKVSSGSYSWQTLGVNRKIVTAAGRTIVDIDTYTTSNIGITGTSRANRVLNGGELAIKHNIAGYTTYLKPENVTWSRSTCTCPVSGKWTGRVEGSNETDDFTVEITGCGTGKITVEGESEDITFDRCAGV